MVFDVVLALLCVAILVALAFRARHVSESFTPVVRLTAREATYSESRAEWDKLQAKFGPDVEFRTVLEVDPPIVPPANPAAKSVSEGPTGPAGPLKPPVQAGPASAPKYEERPLSPPVSFNNSGPRVELVMNDIVKARYPGALTAAGIDPWIRASLSSQSTPSAPGSAPSGSRPGPPAR